LIFQDQNAGINTNPILIHLQLELHPQCPTSIAQNTCTNLTNIAKCCFKHAKMSVNKPFNIIQYSIFQPHAVLNEIPCFFLPRSCHKIDVEAPTKHSQNYFGMWHLMLDYFWVYSTQVFSEKIRTPKSM